MNMIYTIKELPKRYFGGEYTIFSFEVKNGDEPLALHIGTSDDIVTIYDLDKLDGYFWGETFIVDKESYNLFVDFLKSITLKQLDRHPSMRFDVEYAKKYFYVNIPFIEVE